MKEKDADSNGRNGVVGMLFPRKIVTDVSFRSLKESPGKIPSTPTLHPVSERHVPQGRKTLSLFCS
jgi:hypothetical protein